MEFKKIKSAEELEKEEMGMKKLVLLDNLTNYPVIEVACKKSGISRSTFYRWKNENEAFKKAAEAACREGIRMINDLAESKLISNIQQGNNTSIIFWLKNHHQRYTEKIIHNFILPEKTSTEEQNEIAKSIEYIGIRNFIKWNSDISDDEVDKIIRDFMGSQRKKIDS